MTSLIENIDLNLSFNDNTIRVFGTVDEPLFAVKDICDILGLTNPTETLRSVDKDYQHSVEFRAGFSSGLQCLNTVKEPGLYQIIMRCRKPMAKPFQKWVCSEVLPSLRKKGEYKMNEEYQLKLKEIEEEKLKLEEENVNKDKEIKKLQDKVLQKQKRITYTDKNYIYMIQDEYHKLNRTYIIGKAINLTQRISTYNKSRDFEVIYSRCCNSSQQMALIEKCVLFKLDKYREVSNRDRFILPEGKDVSVFKDVIDMFINAFSDVDENVDIEKFIGKEEEAYEKRIEYREDNKEKLKNDAGEYREERKDALALKNKIYRENNLDRISDYQKEYREKNKDVLSEIRKKRYEEHKEEYDETNKQYRISHKEELKELSKTYYEEHKEEMKEYKKERYELTKDAVIEQSKEYYEEHKEEVLARTKARYNSKKEEILAYQSEKIECECGIKIQRNYMAKHKKTEIHKISLKTKENGIKTERSDKIDCECGHPVRVGYMKRHLDSKIHEKLL